MSQTIFKYPLIVDGNQKVLMPKGAKIISLQTQNDVPCIWAIVDTDSEIEERHFKTVATGGNIRNNFAQYIGTYLLNNGNFVGHVFECT